MSEDPGGPKLAEQDASGGRLWAYSVAVQSVTMGGFT